MEPAEGAARATGRLRLAGELRRLRALAGVSGRELARRIAISQSKVSRIESGAVMPSLPEVAAWGAALEVSEETRERLVLLTNVAYTEIQPWREVLQGQGHAQDDVREQEESSRRIRIVQTAVVPGLLQTADYARRVFTLLRPPYAEGDVSAAVAARLHRQRLVFDETRQFEFLLTESALRWRPGPRRVLLAQWDRISSIGTLENVSIGVIPYDREAVVTPTHGFVIYDTYDHSAFVTVELIHATMTVSEPGDVGLYEEQWALLRQMAIFGDEVNEYLTLLTNDGRTGHE
jgi:transcriptional regulator with XRE-family HTH domain